MVTGHRESPTALPLTQLLQKFCGIGDVFLRLKHFFHRREASFVPVVINLHTAHIDKIDTSGLRGCKFSQGIRFAGGKVTATLNIQREGVQTALLAGFGQPHRIENTHWHIEFFRAVQDMALTRSTMRIGFKAT